MPNKTRKPAVKKTPAAKKAAPALRPAPAAEPAATQPAPPGEHSEAPDYVRLPRREKGDTTTVYVRRYLPFVIAAYATGHSLEGIGESFDPPLSGVQLRYAIGNDADMYRQFSSARDYRAHFLVEEATSAAMKVGLAKDRADALLKVAEKTAPHLYGAKSTVALTGANDGPIESKVEMTPSEAYAAMLRGVK